MKQQLLEEIAALIKSDETEENLELGAMKFLSEEELLGIKNSLLKRKEQRHEEQESWYNEWSKKFKK